jgi:hypothetical protein
LIQDRPEYTNLKTRLGSEEFEDEAFGLFSSRIVQYRSIQLSADMILKYLPATDRQFLTREAGED